MGGIEAIENKNIAGILGPCVCCVATCDNLSSKVMSVAFRGRGEDFPLKKEKMFTYFAHVTIVLQS